MRKFNITVNGTTYVVEVTEVGGAPAVSSITPAARAAMPAPAPIPMPAPMAVSAPAVVAASPAAPAAPVPAGATAIVAPMPGKILSVAVKPGQNVKKGELLLVLEAMKMANEIVAPADGTIAEVRTDTGQMVKHGDVLVVL